MHFVALITLSSRQVILRELTFLNNYGLCMRTRHTIRYIRCFSFLPGQSSFFTKINFFNSLSTCATKIALQKCRHSSQSSWLEFRYEMQINRNECQYISSLIYIFPHSFACKTHKHSHFAMCILYMSLSAISQRLLLNFTSSEMMVSVLSI